MTKNKNKPKLRFSEFDEEWEEKKIANILKSMQINVLAPCPQRGNASGY